MSWSDDAAWQLLDLWMRMVREMPKPQIDGITRGENLTLLFLLSNEGVNPKGISEFSGVSTARMAKMLNNLEAKGFVRREDSQKDKRCTDVYITDSGREYITAQIAQSISLHKNTLEALGENDTKEYIRITNKILDITTKNKL